MIYISCVLHQWDLDQQAVAAKRLVELSRPGTMIFGLQTGSVTPKVVYQPMEDGRQKHGYFKHDSNTWAQMWDRVGKETKTRWEASAILKTWKEIGADPAGTA
jgi:hypothetical protein